MDQRKHKRYPFFKQFIFLDLILDPAARPVYIFFILNILIGTMLYRLLEEWSWLDSLYFVIVTITTIGYGDLVPTKPITKFLTVFFAINGIVILLTLYDEIRRLRDPRRNKHE